jgi:hypothetical protein
MTGFQKRIKLVGSKDEAVVDTIFVYAGTY